MTHLISIRFYSRVFLFLVLCHVYVCSGRTLPNAIVYIGDGVVHRVTQPNSNIKTHVDVEMAYCFSSSRPLFGPRLNVIEGENTTEVLKSIACHSLYNFRYQHHFSQEFAFELPTLNSDQHHRNVYH